MSILRWLNNTRKYVCQYCGKELKASEMEHFDVCLKCWGDF